MGIKDFFRRSRKPKYEVQVRPDAVRRLPIGTLIYPSDWPSLDVMEIRKVVFQEVSRQLKDAGITVEKTANWFNDEV